MYFRSTVQTLMKQSVRVTANGNMKLKEQFLILSAMNNSMNTVLLLVSES